MHIRDLSTGVMVFFIKEGFIQANVFKVLEGKNKLEEYIEMELNREMVRNKKRKKEEEEEKYYDESKIGHA